MLKISNAHKRFGAHTVLNDVNLNVAIGDVVGLAGPSGGGKSTLLRCIQGLETIDSGNIELKGETGFVFQDFQLFPHMNVLQNLVYAPKIQQPHKDHNMHAMELLARLGIARLANANPRSLSGGEKQRVALARSLMMHPSLLLCDEPTSGLDVATTMDVVALLNSVLKMGVTMVIASHDLDFLTQIAGRIVILKGGVIVSDVQPKELENPVLQLKGYY